jgi:hypothetical protein
LKQGSHWFTLDPLFKLMITLHDSFFHESTSKNERTDNRKQDSMLNNCSGDSCFVGFIRCNLSIVKIMSSRCKTYFRFVGQGSHCDRYCCSEQTERVDKKPEVGHLFLEKYDSSPDPSSLLSLMMMFLQRLLQSLKKEYLKQSTVRGRRSTCQESW